MNSVRTSSLFHYTKYHSLKRILVSGLIPNYCSEDLSVGGTELTIGLPMISFCDIPLTRTDEFCSRYGNFAIGLSKDWALRNNVNPILYVVDNDIIVSLRFYHSYEQTLHNQVVQAGGNTHSIEINLNDPASVQNIAPFVNHHNAYEANRKLFGYVKRYESEWRGKPLVNYVESEWRYVVGESEQIGWFWTRDEYMAWRGDVNGVKPEPTPELKLHRLSFSAEDVTHIIVQNENQVTRLIEFIDSSDFRHIGGSETPVTEKEKKILISRIISQERVAKDF